MWNENLIWTFQTLHILVLSFWLPPFPVMRNATCTVNVWSMDQNITLKWSSSFLGTPPPHVCVKTLFSFSTALPWLCLTLRCTSSSGKKKSHRPWLNCATYRFWFIMFQWSVPSNFTKSNMVAIIMATSHMISFLSTLLEREMCIERCIVYLIITDYL